VGKGIIFCGWDSPWGENFLGGGFFRGNLNCGNRPEFLYEILLISCFLFADAILRLDILRVIVLGKFSPGLNG
jgi:hypothetical protein